MPPKVRAPTCARVSVDTCVHTHESIQEWHQTMCLHANTHVWPVPFVHILTRVPSWARARACVLCAREHVHVCVCPSARVRLCAHVLTCTVWVGRSALGLTSGRCFPRGEFAFAPLFRVDGVDPGGVKDQW